MKKLKIALIISLFINIILCSLIPFFITFDNKYKGFTFIIKNNEAIIESYDGEYDTINIPSKVKYHGKKYLVTELYNNDGIFDKIPNSITIPQTIKKIGIIFKTNVEYYNKSNSKLKINYLGSIKDWCNIIFYEQPFFNYIDSTKINEINYMPAICERELIIDGKIITKITKDMLDGITEIKNNTFRGYSFLEEIELPNSIKLIGNYAFYDTTIKKIIVENKESWQSINCLYNSFNDINKIEIVYKNKY